MSHLNLPDEFRHISFRRSDRGSFTGWVAAAPDGTILYEIHSESSPEQRRFPVEIAVVVASLVIFGPIVLLAYWEDIPGNGPVFRDPWRCLGTVLFSAIPLFGGLGFGIWVAMRYRPRLPILSLLVPGNNTAPEIILSELSPYGARLQPIAITDIAGNCGATLTKDLILSMIVHRWSIMGPDRQPVLFIEGPFVLAAPFLGWGPFWIQNPIGKTVGSITRRGPEVICEFRPDADVTIDPRIPFALGAFWACCVHRGRSDYHGWRFE